MWRFHNPVDVKFGSGCLATLPERLNGRRYALVTYDEPFFAQLTETITTLAGAPQVVINNVEPNPDIINLEPLCKRLSSKGQPEVIVALGGGSVMDTAKFLAAAGSDFEQAKSYLTEGGDKGQLLCTPVIAIPTTAGTGSEVTCWATIWDKEAQRKYSLADAGLYPETALCDPDLTLQLPVALTLSTGLDALSHALESIWNKNRNGVSSTLAVEAVKIILDTLPRLVRQPDNARFRTDMMKAALKAGLAFSNTKTSIAHNISYAVTLQSGTPHGIACSFTLPQVLRSVIGLDHEVDSDLKAIFGHDLDKAWDQFDGWFRELGVNTDPEAYGYNRENWRQLLLEALQGERGKNFIGQQEALLACY